MKKLIAVIVFLFVFSIPAYSETVMDKDLKEALKTDNITHSLDDESAEYLHQYGISPESSDWVNNLNARNVFKHIGEFLRSGMKRPFKSGAALIGIVLISAALTSFGSDSGRFSPALFAAVLAGAALILGDLWQSISAAVTAIKGTAVFMLGFIPSFAAVTALSGQTATSASMSALLLFAAEGISAFASFLILPLMGGYLSLCLSESVSPLIKSAAVSDALKKLSNWGMSLITILFTGILGIQTAINSSADSLGIKTTKFIVGTSVPVAGTALSEAASTIYSSMSLLKSTFGMYAVVALLVIMLPVLCELLIWRLTLNLCLAISNMLEIPKFSGLIKAVDTVISVLIGILLLVVGMFIICLTIVVASGG